MPLVFGIPFRYFLAVSCYTHQHARPIYSEVSQNFGTDKQRAQLFVIKHTLKHDK